MALQNSLMLSIARPSADADEGIDTATSVPTPPASEWTDTSIYDGKGSEEGDTFKYRCNECRVVCPNIEGLCSHLKESSPVHVVCHLCLKEFYGQSLEEKQISKEVHHYQYHRVQADSKLPAPSEPALSNDQIDEEHSIPTLAASDVVQGEVFRMKLGIPYGQPITYDTSPVRDRTSATAPVSMGVQEACRGNLEHMAHHSIPGETSQTNTTYGHMIDASLKVEQPLQKNEDEGTPQSLETSSQGNVNDYTNGLARPLGKKPAVSELMIASRQPTSDGIVRLNECLRYYWEPVIAYTDDRDFDYHNLEEERREEMAWLDAFEGA